MEVLPPNIRRLLCERYPDRLQQLFAANGLWFAGWISCSPAGNARQRAMPDPTTTWKADGGGLWITRSDRGSRERFVIQGVCYRPTPLGTSSLEDPLGSQHDAIWGRDLPLLRAMGANAIRIYGMDSGPDQRDPEGAPPLTGSNAFLDAAWNGGDEPIFVLLSSWIDAGTFASADRTEKVCAKYDRIARSYGGHRSVLGFSIGAEFNTPADDAARTTPNPSIRDDTAEKAERRYWENFKKVVTTLRNRIGGQKIITTGLIDGLGPEQFLERALRHGATVDVWGFNLYKAREWFHVAWTDYETRFGGATRPPLLVGEFGVPASTRIGTAPDWTVAEAPAGTEVGTLGDVDAYLRQAWNVIVTRPSHACGGFVFEWTDEWSKQRDDCDGDAQTEIVDQHDKCTDWSHDGSRTKATYFAPDAHRDEEWFGLNAIARGTPNILRARPAHELLKQLWKTRMTTQTIDLPNIPQGWFMTWTMSTQSANNFCITLADNTTTYVNNKCRKNQAFGILDQDDARVQGTGLKLTVTATSDGPTPPNLVWTTNAFFLTDPKGRNVGVGYNIAFEDWVDQDFNDFYVSVVAWRSSG